MRKKEISGGTVHDLPADLKKALTSDAKALETWEDITPLARNEWICWIESAKKVETRSHRIEMGLFQPQRRKAETLLLAWLFASLRSSGSGPPPAKTSSASLPKPDWGMRTSHRLLLPWIPPVRDSAVAKVDAR